jgi:hypothetical protein
MKDSELEDLYNVEKSINLDYDRDFDDVKNGDDGRKSIGMISRIENFDRDFLQRLLRKDGWDQEDPALYDDYANNMPDNFDNSLEDRYSVAMKKTNKGGDLSPHRNSIMHKKNIPKELTHPQAAQISFSINNFSKRIDKNGSFATPNKADNRYSIGFSKRKELSSFRNFNLLNVATMMNDNNIDFSASRRKSMRVFSQKRSKVDSKSDISYPKNHREENKSHARAGASFSPISNAAREYEVAKRLDEGAMPFNVTSKNKEEKERPLSDKLSGYNEPYINDNEVVHEVAEADEDEKLQHENSQNKVEVSDSNSRLKDELANPDLERVKSNENIKVENDW